MVLDKGNVQSCFSPELYVGAGEEIKGSLLETAL